MKSIDEQKEKLKFQKQIIKEINGGFFNRKEEIKGLYHYTSIRTLFEMLENDSFWVSKTRFSNDSSEERVFDFEDTNEALENDDNYMFCLSTQGDSLSQWRGYCHNGGVSIGLRLSNINMYSVLHKDYDDSKKYERIINAPLPIIYVESNSYCNPMSGRVSNPSDNKEQLLIWNHIKEQCSKKKISPYAFRPFIKSNVFIDEHEYRLLFPNQGGNLGQCIRFRTLKNDIKVPYIVVKVGDMAENYTKCVFDIKDITKDNLIKLANDNQPIIKIPQGSDQETIYYQVESAVNQCSNELACKISIECAGHLPISEIRVSPTYNRSILAEEISRYCKSKYWLRGVSVTYSTIPYIPPTE